MVDGWCLLFPQKCLPDLAGKVIDVAMPTISARYIMATGYKLPPSICDHHLGKDLTSQSSWEFYISDYHTYCSKDYLVIQTIPENVAVKLYILGENTLENIRFVVKGRLDIIGVGMLGLRGWYPSELHMEGNSALPKLEVRALCTYAADVC
jgi:hypothetical protein